MIHPHNPIMQRLEEMAGQWKQKVKPSHRLIRWLLKPEETRMYEGFCRLEASAHGFLDNLFIFFYTPFQSQQQFSHAIMKNWLHEYDSNADQRKLLQQKGISGEWNVELFRSAVLSNKYKDCDQLLPRMLDSWRQWLQLPDTVITLGLLPKETSSPIGFSAWMQQWMLLEKAASVQLIVLDHNPGNYWGTLFEKFNDESITLTQDLRMQQAIREIATSGAATDPHAFYRLCLFEMGESANKKQPARLHEWGQKAIDAAKKCGDKNLLATAYISYAGMLFNFREHEKIDSLLNEGWQLCKQQVAAGDQSMQPLLLQFYAYKGAHCQVQKQRKEALHWFFKMGEEAMQMRFYTQALSAYYKAFIFADYKNMMEERKKAVQLGISLTPYLQPEEIQASEYPFLAYEYDKMTSEKEDTHKKTVIITMEKAYDKDWRQTVESLKKNYTKQRLRQAEHAPELTG
jgi:hypothetical protein